MTVDELVKLTDTFVHHMGLDLPGMIQGAHANVLGAWHEDQLLLLVKYLSGDRPVVDAVVPVATTPPRERRFRPIPDDVDDVYEPPSGDLPTGVERTTKGPLVLGGAFGAEGTIQLP